MRVISRLHSRGLIGRNKRFLAVYLASFIVSFHYALIIYANSSFLSIYFSKTAISFLYVFGSLLWLILLLSAESFIRQLKLKLLFILFVILEAISIAILAGGSTPILIAFGFIAQQGAIGFLGYIMDIMLEREINDESTTGEARGFFLGSSNLAFVISPLLAGLIISTGNFSSLYFVSLAVLVPVIFLHFNKRLDGHVMPREHKSLPKELRLGVFLNFLLQFFYGWMIIWSPIYLNKIAGLSWPEIGIMFSIMLLPFALFELPLGELADKMFGEKEIMSIGFFLAAVGTAALAIISSNSFIGWTLALFLTRTGACAIEISTESYFFKHVSGRDAGIIGVFRMVKPLSLIFAPVIGFLAITLVGFPASFAVLGAILFGGGFAALRLKDTL